MIKAGDLILMGLTVISGTDVTIPPEVVIYDNNAASSGTVLTYTCLPTASDSKYVSFGTSGVRAADGIFVDIIGTGVKAIVYYRI